MDWMSGVRSPAGQRIFLVASESRPALRPTQPPCPVGTGGPYLGGKVWPGHNADHSPSSGAEVKNELELYPFSPKHLHGV
jgi:hypothetical protein